MSAASATRLLRQHGMTPDGTMLCVSPDVVEVLLMDTEFTARIEGAVEVLDAINPYLTSDGLEVAKELLSRVRSGLEEMRARFAERKTS